MSTEVRLFGSIQVTCGDRRLGAGDFGGRKPKQLLEILVLHGGRYVAKDQLTELLWGGRLPANANGALEHYVSLLRRRLEPAGARHDSVLVTAHGGYRFDCDRAWVDVTAFDRIASRPAGDLDAADIDEALSVATGELLEDEPYAEWALEARLVCRQQRVRLLIAGAEGALATGEVGQARELAASALGVDPLAEAAHRALMTSHYLAGNQKEALLAFRRCQRNLAEEVGIDPQPQTVALQRSILAHEPLDQAPRDWVVLTGRPPGRPVASGAAADPTSQSHPERTDLLGRRSELGGLVAACSRQVGQTTALVVVDGEAGVGKSRLLDEAAERLVDRPAVRVRCARIESGLAGSLASSLVGRLADRQSDTPGQLHLPAGTEVAGSGFVSHLVASLAGALAHCGPVVIMVDDAHWADPDSIAVLACLARRGPTDGGAIVFACRSEELAANHPLGWVEPDLRLSLEPLTAEDLAPLALSDPHDLHEATGGLPLHVVRRLESLVGGDLAAAVDTQRVDLVARLRRHGDQLLPTAVVAAVLPQPCGPEEVARLLMREPLAVVDELEQLCALRILRLSGPGFAFRYPGVREALRDTVSPARRRLLERVHRTASSSAERRVQHRGLPPKGDRRRGPADRRGGRLVRPGRWVADSATG